MPTTRIEIENVGPRWVCEAEFGGATVARRVALRADTLDELIRQLSAAYHERMGTEDPLGVNETPVSISVHMPPATFSAQAAAEAQMANPYPSQYAGTQQATNTQGLARLTQSLAEESPLVHAALTAGIAMVGEAGIEAVVAPYGRKADGTPKKKPGGRKRAA